MPHHPPLPRPSRAATRRAADPRRQTGPGLTALTFGTAIALTLGVLIAAPAFGETSAEPVQDGAPNVPEFTPAFAEQTDAPAMQSDVDLMQTEIATGLVHPWAVTVLPDGAGYLVTERPGDLRHVAMDGTVSDPISGVPDVYAVNQGGLLDIALAPDFAESRIIYLSYAKPMGGGLSVTAAARATLSDDMQSLDNVTEIWAQAPPSPTPMHYGSRVIPTDDGMVFITTGEHSSRAERDLAQTLDATYGKVIRVHDDGTVPDDNPFVDMQAANASIWSFGHRNIQGAAMHPETGDLWIIEHGPAGGDELNLIAEGANYGWPIVSYGENYGGSPIGAGTERHEPEFTEPRYYWDPVIAPGGMVFYDGEMFPEWQGNVLAAGLVSASVVRLAMDGDTVTGEERLAEGIGRVRDVALDADGSVLVVTDFADGALIRLHRP